MRSLVTTDELAQELARIGRDEVLGAGRVVAVEVLPVRETRPFAAGVGTELRRLYVTVEQNQAATVYE